MRTRPLVGHWRVAIGAIGGILIVAGAVRTPHVTAQAAPSAGALRLTADRVDAFVQAGANHLDYLPGEVLVKFKPGMGPADQQRALSSLRSRPSVDDMTWSSGIAVLRVADQPDAHALAAQLSDQPEVLYAEPNYLRRLPARRSPVTAPVSVGAAPRGTPNDTDFSAYQWNFTELDMPKAWDINPGATSSIIVANIDTGVTVSRQVLTFPLFTGTAIQNVNLTFNVSPDFSASRFVSPYDFVFFGSGGPVIDFDGHGTHTASTIGEDTGNALGLAGMAYNVRFMPVKVCLSYWELMIANAQAGHAGPLPATTAEGCPDDAIQSGIMYAADHGAKVINISLGGPGFSLSVRNAVIYAVQKGAFVAMAMGNDGDTTNFVSYPAADAATIAGAMSVAAVGKSLGHAYYSSTGKHCEIAAPGGDDRDGGGADMGYVWQTTLFYPDQDQALAIPRFDRFDEIGYIGTSMATPHVAGLAALLMSQIPGVTPAQVEAIITRTARDLGAAGKDDQFGNGLIQPRTALFGLGIKK